MLTLFLLQCPNYLEHRRQLFETVNQILLVNNINYLHDQELLRLFIYGEKLTFEANKTLLTAKHNFINKTFFLLPDFF